MQPPLRAPVHALLVLAVLSSAACRNDCVDMCQQMAGWVDECGLDWEAAFPKRHWTSVEDCYDAHWDADPDQERACADRAEEWSDRECY